ncbi:Armadillo repeat-containing protein 8 [Nymphaea thermarum]|nr:Armadillo repeat-containing protein 8 [Nymphaea thermarum]
MPASAAPSPSYGGSQPEELIERLSSGDRNSRLKALRELKNQIIGNRTKKLSYIKLGAVPRVAEILASDSLDAPLLVQSAATIGSFTCGVDSGVTAVLDSGAVPLLIRTLSNPDQKVFVSFSLRRTVVDAAARSLRMIFQSNLAPKYDLFQDENMGFLLSLLNSENENVTELAGSIITRSCETSFEQQALCNAGVLQRIVSLLSGSTSQRDASLDSLAAIMKNNYETVSRFISLEDGRALNAVIDFIKDRAPRTRLLACVCLIAIGHACPCYMHDLQLKIKMVLILTQLIEEPGRPGDESPFALKELMNSSMELQNASVSVTAVEKICDFLPRASLQNRRFEGVLLVLAEICSKVEERRSQLLDSKVCFLIKLWYTAKIHVICASAA